MDKNYEWQRQYTKQRFEARRREAEAHRAMQKDAAHQSLVTFPIVILRRIGRALKGLTTRRPQWSVDPSSDAKTLPAE